MCCFRKPHGRARSIVAKFNRMFGVKAFVSDKANKEKWEAAGVKIEGGYDDFFAASDFLMVGTPGDEELPYVEAGLANDCFCLHHGGGRPVRDSKGLKDSKKLQITDDLEGRFRPRVLLRPGEL